MVLRRSLITVLTTITLVLSTLGVEDVTVITSGGVYKVVNRNFVLECDVHHSMGPTVSYDIIWRHNGTVLSNVLGVSLAVNQAQVGDSGTYSCTVNGSAVTPVTGYLNITVECEYCTMMTLHVIEYWMYVKQADSRVYSLTHAQVALTYSLSFLVFQLIQR